MIRTSDRQTRWVRGGMWALRGRRGNIAGLEGRRCCEKYLLAGISRSNAGKCINLAYFTLICPPVIFVMIGIGGRKATHQTDRPKK